ncbi:MAG: hypothetical protein KU37_07470 [Sulfuricurvum sp. PC08-66]|nr:MAG: hypothetical protein KU37_07470 [Sulfuricurvum sp. PC08-66]
MSTLRTQINDDLKTAMKNQETVRRDALRLLTSALKQIEVDERKTLTDEEILTIIQKQLKQRDDSLTQFKAAGREDLVAKEQAEIDVFLTYMPTQLTPDELKSAIIAIIAEVGATSMKDIGRVMATANKTLAGRTNGKAINEMAKTLLG